MIERDATSARVALAAAQMLLLDGDDVSIEIEVGAGCTLELDDIGGTVAYPGSSSWRLRAHVGAGGRLLWHGLPYVITTDARSRRQTDLILDPTATVLLRETLVLGRHGEIGGTIDSGITATCDDRPVLVERLEADAVHPGPGVLGDHRVVDSVIAIGFRPAPRPGDLELEHPGAVARFLGHDTHSSELGETWAVWRAALSRPASPTAALD